MRSSGKVTDEVDYVHRLLVVRTAPHAPLQTGGGTVLFFALRSQAPRGLHDVPRMGLISSRPHSHHRPASLLASNPFCPAIPFGTGLSRAPATDIKLSFRLTFNPDRPRV